jgi:hypothetical protein
MHELLPQLHLGIPTSAETPKDSETLFLSFLDSRHLSSLSLSLCVSVSVSSLQNAKCNNTNMRIFPLVQYKQDPAAVQLEILRSVLMDFLL